MNINGTPLDQVEKFKYLGVEFPNDARLDCEIDRRIESASAILCSLYRSVVTKKEVSRRTKMAIFNAVYRPALIYGHEQWVMTERIRSRIRAAEMRFLRRAAGLTLQNRIRSSTIRESLKAESLLLHIERSQFCWLGHVLRMPHERLAHQVFETMPQGKRPVGRPRLTWRNYVARLCQERLGLTRGVNTGGRRAWGASNPLLLKILFFMLKKNEKNCAFESILVTNPYERTCYAPLLPDLEILAVDTPPCLRD